MSQYNTPHSLVELKENIQEIQQQVDAVCQRIGRSPTEVRLLPVTKTLPAERVEQAYQLGFHCFSEYFLYLFKLILPMNRVNSG